MARSSALSHLSLALLYLFFNQRCCAVTFTLTNNCGYTVWPGILSGAGTAPLRTTGFALQKGESQSLDAPASWSGRLWGRTLCTAADSSTAGAFACGTGDCGSGKVECAGGGAAPPATLAEFTLDGSGGMDFYDVSLVDGYNIAMLVTPQPRGVGGGGGVGNCSATGCLVDLNGACPADLKVVPAASGDGGESVACKSACEAFGSPEYCCSGQYGNPSTCRPSEYSEFFKNACPKAYSYAYDDATSTFTCAAGADYLITFCPASATSHKSKEKPVVTSRPTINAQMIFFGGQDVSGSMPAVPLHLLTVSVHVAAAATMLLLNSQR